MELSGISTDDILDFIFQEIDDIQIDGNFKEIDNIFDEININNMNDITLLGLLTVTYPHRNKYKNREKFRYNVKEFIRINNTAEEAEKLLQYV